MPSTVIFCATAPSGIPIFSIFRYCAATSSCGESDDDTAAGAGAALAVAFGRALATGALALAVGELVPTVAAAFPALAVRAASATSGWMTR